MINNSENKKVLLYSGGLDSWLIDKIWKPDIKLYIDIKGSYSSEEIRRLPPDVKVVDFPLLGKFEADDKFIPLRNLYFLMIASNYGNELCIGAVAGDGSKDKNKEFLDRTDDMLNYLWHDKKINKDIVICKDFITKSKSEILDIYLSQNNNIDIVRNNTFSCYSPKDGKECFDCYPCFRKFALLFSKGASYSYEERKSIWNYVKNNVIPTKEEGGYPGTYYTDRGEESKVLIYAVEKLKEEFSNE